MTFHADTHAETAERQRQASLGNVIDVRIDLISARGRFRRDFGDIPGLAHSIDEIGLLQPIGIDSGYRLVFGERRMRAFLHLGRETIPARFVNLDSLLKGEFAENEFRKDFTVSERVEIGKALEAELREQADRRMKAGTTSPVENFPEGSRTRDLAAKAAGFGNGKTYEQAKAVIERGAPELVEAMDAGRVSVSAAAAVAELPKTEQREVVHSGKAKEIAKAARATGKPKTGPKAEAMRQELKEAQQRGVSMLSTYARLTITAIRSMSEFTEEERELLTELEGAISQLRSVSTP